MPVRTADLLVASARLWLAFEAVGHPIGYGEAILVGAASLAAKMLSITPNGLGLSEWAVAGINAVANPGGAAAGAAAALLDRGVEVLVMLVAGGIGMATLRRSAIADRDGT